MRAYTLEPADAEGGARAGEPARRAAADPSRRDAGRDEDRSRTRIEQSPTRFLDSLGVWNGRSLAAHAVWLDDADMDVLAKARRRRGAQSREQHEARERRRRRAEVADARHPRRAGHGRRGQQQRPRHVRGDAVGRAAAQDRRPAIREALPARQALELATRRGAEALGLADRDRQPRARQAGRPHHGRHGRRPRRRRCSTRSPTSSTSRAATTSGRRSWPGAC